MSKPTQRHFFPAGDDLPLFTGKAPTSTPKPPKPKPSHWTQIELMPYRTVLAELFYPRRDRLNNLTGAATKVPAGTLVRIVQQSPQFVNKILVQNEDRLWAWTWSDCLTQI